MSRQELSGRFKAQRVKWTDEEMTLTLAYYFFIFRFNSRKSDYEGFTDDLKQKTGNARSYGSVGMRFSNYNTVNTIDSLRGFMGGEAACKPFWEKYINQDGTPTDQLISIFASFIEQYGHHRPVYDDFTKKYHSFFQRREVDIDDEDGITSTLDSEDFNPEPANYEPEPKPELQEGKTKKYKRDGGKARKSIVLSGFKCCVDPSHVTFLTKNGHQYMEAHHLIPMAAQDEFDTSLDVDANIVSLCPLCHRKLHHGKDNQAELKKLYDLRKDLLEKSGIEIDFEKLASFYK